jgi:tRNA-specific 2-thiouridylase
MRVLAAVSGGVDSAVAMARAVDAGHDVTAVHLALARDPASTRTGARGCCTLEDARDARRAADVVGVPFYVWDLAERFHADVVSDFVAEYAAGRTPNPCLRCNEKIKFAAVLDRALALGFDAVVTGHHARLEDGVLRRSVDAAKDQSYVLAVLTPDQLAHAMFPLGSSTKAEVRAEAAARGLAVADKPDSHDVCFVADGDTRGFLRRALGDRPGVLVDAETGSEVGRHDGAYGFTVGQRRGLGLSRPGGTPRYVLSIEPVAGTVTVGPGAMLDIAAVTGARPVWTAGSPPAPSFPCLAQVRAHARPVLAHATVHPPPPTPPPTAADSRAAGDGVGGIEVAAEWVVEVRLGEPVRGVATGQAVVLYDGDTVLGSATVSATESATARVEPAEAGSLSP